MPPDTDALVIGAGPAGLMAAEVMAQAGLRVTVAEAKPSPARKFLMAGKSGLNITNARPGLAAAYDPPGWLDPILAAFGPDRVQDWCRGLGQEVFTGSTGRVFPVAMKGSPLLRAWLGRLDATGVQLRTRWRWTGWDGPAARFDTPAGPQAITPRVTVLALGGASWARLGSDGLWTPVLAAEGVEIAPFAPANVGFAADWSPAMTRHFGQPLKGARLMASTGRESRGEVVISAKGIEGGGLYPLSRDLRQGATLTLDLLPAIPQDNLATRLASHRPGETLSNRLRKAGLSPVAIALLREWGGALPDHPAGLSTALKSLPARLTGPRPLDEAISTAGGITRGALTSDLELRARPGTFAAGEMLDWEAPTGGYLLTACLATGRHAGLAAVAQTRR